MIHTESLMAPGIECTKQEKPEGGVPCQVPDSPVPCDEEVERERSSTGSLSREAVPKEAPGSLANGTFILVPRSFFLFHFGSGVRT